MLEQENHHIPLGILFAGWLLGFSMFSPMFCVSPITHILKEQLLLNHTQIGLLFSAPILMIVAFAIPAGIISDKIGVRKAAGIGVIILAIGALLRGIAGSAYSLLAFTFIYGAGFGWCYPNLTKLASDYIPKQKAGMAMGIISTGILGGCGVALAITTPIILPLVNTYQGVFSIWGIAPVAAAIVWWIVVKKPQGSVQLETFKERRVSFRGLMRYRQIWILTVIFILHNIFFYTWSGWAPTLLMQKQATPEMAGLLTSLTIWAGIPAGLFMPRLSYKLGLRKPFLWIPAIALTGAAFSAQAISLEMSWAITVVIGIAIMAQFPTILALPVEMVSKEEVGAASGLLISIGYIGGVIGPLIGGRILDITGSLNFALLILAGASIAIVCMTFMLRETGSTKKLVISKGFKKDT